MQLDKETKLKQEKERCRQLAQRVAEEARPASAQVLNSESDLLEKALRRAGIRAEEWSAQAAEPVDLLVVEAAQRPFPQPQPRAAAGKDPERRYQFHVLEADLAHAVCRQQEPPDLAHVPAVRLPA